MEKKKSSGNLNDGGQKLYGLTSLNPKLSRSEPVTFSNYYTDLKDLLGDFQEGE